MFDFKIKRLDFWSRLHGGDCVIVYEILLFRLFTIVYDQDSDHVIKILYCDSLSRIN